MTAIVTKCKAAMKSMLSKAEKTASDANHNSYQLTPLKECLNVLKSAMIHNYTDIIALAVTSIARFGYFMYNGVDHSKEFYPGLDSRIDDNNETRYGDIYRDCDVLFKSLTLEIRYKILSERLMKVSDNYFR